MRRNALGAALLLATVAPLRPAVPQDGTEAGAAIAPLEVLLPEGLDAAGGSASLAGLVERIARATGAEVEEVADAFRSSGLVLPVAAADLLGVGPDSDLMGLGPKGIAALTGIFQLLRERAVAGRMLGREGTTARTVLVVRLSSGESRARWRTALERFGARPADTARWEAGETESVVFETRPPAGAWRGPAPKLCVAHTGDLLVLASDVELGRSVLRRAGPDPPPGFLQSKEVAATLGALPAREDLWNWTGSRWLRRAPSGEDPLGRRLGDALGAGGIEGAACRLSFHDRQPSEDLVVRTSGAVTGLLGAVGAASPPPRRPPAWAGWKEAGWASWDWRKVGEVLAGVYGGLGLPDLLGALREGVGVDLREEVLARYSGPVVAWIPDAADGLRILAMHVSDPDALRGPLERLAGPAPGEPRVAGEAGTEVYEYDAGAPPAPPGFEWLPGPFLGRTCALAGDRLVCVCGTGPRARALLQRAVTALAAQRGPPQDEGPWAGDPSGQVLAFGWTRSPLEQPGGHPLDFLRPGGPRTVAPSPLGVLIARARILPALSGALSDLSESVTTHGPGLHVQVRASWRRVRPR